MTITEEQRKELDDGMDEVIKWLNDNCHPHVTLIVTNSGWQLFEGLGTGVNHKHWKD